MLTCILVEYRPVTDLLDDLDINNTLTSKGTFCEVALDKSIFQNDFLQKKHLP